MYCAWPGPIRPRSLRQAGVDEVGARPARARWPCRGGTRRRRRPPRAPRRAPSARRRRCAVYSIGISQPPKSASLAPRATCRSCSGRAQQVGHAAKPTDHRPCPTVVRRPSPTTPDQGRRRRRRGAPQPARRRPRRRGRAGRRGARRPADRRRCTRSAPAAGRTRCTGSRPWGWPTSRSSWPPGSAPDPDSAEAYRRALGAAVRDAGHARPACTSPSTGPPARWPRARCSAPTPSPSTSPAAQAQPAHGRDRRARATRRPRCAGRRSSPTRSPSSATWSTPRPTTCYPPSFADRAAQAGGRARAAGRGARRERPGPGRVRRHPRRRRGQHPAAAARPDQLPAGRRDRRTWRWSARASPSTPAGSTSRPQHMAWMKSDMGGAAAVIASVLAAARSGCRWRSPPPCRWPRTCRPARPTARPTSCACTAGAPSRSPTPTPRAGSSWPTRSPARPRTSRTGSSRCRR